MRRAFSLYPKNKISTSTAMFQLPLKNISFSSEKNNINEPISNTAFPKSKKIKKLIDEINLTNPRPTKIKNETNNLYICQKMLREEILKNKNFSEKIFLLNKHIDDLELKLKNYCQFDSNNNSDDELIRLRQENQELKLFKEKVYEFSTKYDEINKDILNCLKCIEKIVQIYNMQNPSLNIEYSNNTLNKMSEQFKSVINNFTNFMTVKQEEYNTLLKEKENEIEKLKREFNCDDNIDYYSNGLKSYNNYGENKNKTFDYKNINKINQMSGRDKSNTCNYNDFGFENNKKKFEFKSTINKY